MVLGRPGFLAPGATSEREGPSTAASSLSSARGTLTFRQTGDTPDVRADYNVVQDLFGVSSVSELSAASISSLKLPRDKGNNLTKKKINSILFATVPIVGS